MARKTSVQGAHLQGESRHSRRELCVHLRVSAAFMLLLNVSFQSGSFLVRWLTYPFGLTLKREGNGLPYYFQKASCYVVILELSWLLRKPWLPPRIRDIITQIPVFWPRWWWWWRINKLKREKVYIVMLSWEEESGFQQSPMPSIFLLFIHYFKSQGWHPLQCALYSHLVFSVLRRAVAMFPSSFMQSHVFHLQN